MSVPIVELALTALARLPGIRNVRTERESKSEASFTLETDEADAPRNMQTQIEGFGLMLSYAQRLDFPP
ncbi:hypothetical protein [Lysobacter sp. Hz 25]|uniref:hypothetical protein n=1 Tax=Lysobacter sp. Hz 25 TaxID=3383698 RepID=UPI0038D4E96C